MTFPVYFHLFGHAIHPHPVLEVIAYTGGAQMYFWLRRRERKRLSPVPIEANLYIICGCVVGALIGAKLLALAESLRQISAAAATDPMAWLAGKTIVGGLLGGWVGVEIVKKLNGVRRSTGDLFVFPLIFGIAVGRVGCFLTGLDDQTHGVATNLPWGIDFGDGVRRHPAQLYEFGWLLVLGGILLAIRRRPASATDNNQQGGRLFRLFMIGYLGYRFAIEFIKPSDKPLLGLSAIQVACVAGVLVCLVQLTRRRSLNGRESGATATSTG